MMNATIIKQGLPQGSNYFLHVIAAFSHTGYLFYGYELQNATDLETAKVILTFQNTPLGQAWYYAYSPMTISVPIPSDWVGAESAPTKMIVQLFNMDTGKKLAEVQVENSVQTSHDHVVPDLRPM